MTEHTCTRHEPGTRSCRWHCGCQCDACRDAARAYTKAQWRRKHPVPRQHPADLVEVSWLLEMGESPDTVAARLQTTVGAIARRAYRAGRLDLAQPFERAQRTHRQETAA